MDVDRDRDPGSQDSPLFAHVYARLRYEHLVLHQTDAMSCQCFHPLEVKRSTSQPSV